VSERRWSWSNLTGGDMTPAELLRFHARRTLGFVPARALTRGRVQALLLEWLTPDERRDLALAGLRDLGGDTLEESAALLVEWSRADDRGAHYAADGYLRLRAQLAAHGGLEGKVLLELGTGHSLAQGALLVAGGAARYHGVDPFPVARRDSAHYRRVRTLLSAQGLLDAPGQSEARAAAVVRFDAALGLDHRAEVHPDPLLLALHRCPASELPLADESVDACVSTSAFEHFRRPGQAARESVRVLRSGGVGLHIVDFRDHRFLHDRPLAFLCHSHPEWERVFQGEPNRYLSHELGLSRSAFQYTNRWRLGRYVQAFEEAGAEVEVEPLLERPLRPGEREVLHPEFRDCEAVDLEVLSALLTVRKR
jgi:SAM-dependent methyltransferase